MTLETLTAEDDDGYVEAELRAQGSDPRAIIEDFTGTTLEHLMRVGYVVASRRLRNREDREDVVQEAFTRVIAAARRRDVVPRNAGAYFARIVLNVIIDMWKAQLADKRGGGATALALDERLQVKDRGPTPADSTQNSELHRRIIAAIETLSPANREVLELAIDIDSGDFNRMSHADIAKHLGLETKIVKSRLHEAKKKLAICLADWREEEFS